MRRLVRAWRRLDPEWAGVVRALLAFGVLLAIQALAQRALASTTLIASLLAPSPASGLLALSAATGFLVLRILTLALMPAFIASRIATALWALSQQGSRRSQVRREG